MNLESIEDDEVRLKQAPELPLTSAPLKAAAHQIHSACKSYMDNFMLCKQANGNPQTCIDQNIQLTKCAFEAYHHITNLLHRIRLIQEKCNQTYTNYWKCLDANNHLLFMCREEEAEFNSCAKEKCKMNKQLWLHTRYEEPLRDMNDFPESISPNYAKFVKKNKDPY